MIHRRINTAIQWLTLPILSYWMQFQKKKSFILHIQHMYILDSSSNSCHQQSTIRKEEGLIIPSCIALPFPNSSCLLQQHELNSTSDAAEKFSVPAKLLSTRLLIPLLTTVFPFFPKNCPFSFGLSYRSVSSTFVSFVQKLQPYTSARPPSSIITSPTLAIIRSRHANLLIHHLPPKSTKLPMWK
jgi:hypothetical protein